VEAVVLISLAFNYQIWIKGRVTRRLEKNWPNFFLKKPKSQKGKNIYNKAQFESQKHLQQTTFETLKYLQQTML
jgi:hypothetical protein